MTPNCVILAGYIIISSVGTYMAPNCVILAGYIIISSVGTYMTPNCVILAGIYNNLFSRYLYGP